MSVYVKGTLSQKFVFVYNMQCWLLIYTMSGETGEGASFYQKKANFDIGDILYHVKFDFKLGLFSFILHKNQL